MTREDYLMAQALVLAIELLSNQPGALRPDNNIRDRLAPTGARTGVRRTACARGSENPSLSNAGPSRVKKYISLTIMPVLAAAPTTPLANLN